MTTTYCVIKYLKNGSAFTRSYKLQSEEPVKYKIAIAWQIENCESIKKNNAKIIQSYLLMKNE